MTRQQIDPGTVVTPTQLLAAVLVLVLGALGGLITGASVVTSPAWLPPMFGVCAVVIVPLALVFVFVLLTRYRTNLVNDELFTRTIAQASSSAEQLTHSLDSAGVDTTALISGRANVTENVQEDLSELLASLSRVSQRARDLATPPLDALRAAANGLMAARRWEEAARYFDMYVAQEDANWEVQFTRGVAHANTRGGDAANVAALRAYNEAIALAPPDARPNTMARLFGYRGAIAKRLNRLDQAEHDLLLARSKATASYELDDIAYNLACVYAMTGRKQEALAELRTLREVGKLTMVHAHLDSYFRDLRDDPDFREIVGS